jgi:hypothetical protein
MPAFFDIMNPDRTRRMQAVTLELAKVAQGVEAVMTLEEARLEVMEIRNSLFAEIRNHGDRLIPGPR